MDRVNSLAESFREFAATRYSENRLYANLSLEIANDKEILKLIVDSTVQNPLPHLLFAAIHFIILKLDQKQNLKEDIYNLYKYFSEEGFIPDDFYWIFRDFCITNKLYVQELISTRYIQTNHIQRCMSLLPAFNYIYTKKSSSLSIVELGTSAGLNLLWDKLNYTYRQKDLELCLKGANFSIDLECDFLGDFLPPIPKQFPNVSFRLGIDIHPINLDDENEVLWLSALIWPGQEFQSHNNNLKKAIALAKKHPIPILQGNILDILPHFLYSYLRNFDNLCIFNSYVLYQLNLAERHQLENIFYEFSKTKSFSWISLELINSNTKYPSLELTEYSNGESFNKKLAYCHDQNLWIRWLC